MGEADTASWGRIEGGVVADKITRSNGSRDFQKINIKQRLFATVVGPSRRSNKSQQKKKTRRGGQLRASSPGYNAYATIS